MTRQKLALPEPQSTPSADSIRRSRDRVWEHRMVWMLLFAILGLWCYFSLMGRVDGKLTSEILKRLRQEFPTHIISVDRAHLLAGKSITIEGVRIAKPTDQGLRDVVRCGRIVCAGPFELIGLAQGQFPVQTVEADGVELCLWPLSDSRFSIQELSSSKPLSPNCPTIQVRSGLIRIGAETGRTEQEIILHDFRAHAELAPRLVNGRIMPLTAIANVSVSSSYFNTATFKAAINEDKTIWHAEGKVAKLAYSQRLAQQLPLKLQQYLVQAAGFSGELDAEFTAHSERGQLSYQAKATIDKGRLLHPQVPYPLESISGEVYCSNGLIKLRKVRAASGQASIAFDCDMKGLGIGSPMNAEVSVRNLSLDQRLYEALPVALKETWQKLGVSGLIDATATLAFDGKKWTPLVRVLAKNAGVEPEFFPYPIRNIHGVFVYQNDSVYAEKLTGNAGGQEIQCALTLTRASPRWLMDLKLAADGPIPIDEALLRALSQRGAPESGLHKFVLSLHPTGTVHLNRAHFQRLADQPEMVSRSLELTFSECEIKYDGFRYPIHAIQGSVILDNERLLMKDFVGRNDGARIKGHGICQGKNSNLESMELFFEGYDVSLDEELQNALPKNVRGLWDQLQPSGAVDQIAVKIARSRANDPIDLRVEFTEKRAREMRSGGAVSIRPASLPYQINDVECNILYRPGRIDIHSLMGYHENSRLETSGQCTLYSDGTWNGLLNWKDLTRVHVDQSLLSCLPPYLREPLAKLDFRGPVSIIGTTNVSSPPSPAESIVRSWDLELNIEDGDLGGGSLASGIRGAMTLAGTNTLNGPMCYGNLDLDALAVKGIAVTRVVGPFAFNRKELLLGRDAVSWQQKNNVPHPRQNHSQNENSVVTAVYTTNDTRGMNSPSSAVSQAGFRGNVRSALSNRLDALNPNAPVKSANPNAIRSPEQMPPLDVLESDISARTLSGELFVSGTEAFDGLKRSNYRLRLVEADFQGFLVDLGETNSQAKGLLSIECDLQGALTNTASLGGQGTAWLREANVYDLPAMVKLVRLLSIRPGQGAFDSADIKFGIDGDRLPIHELVLDGDILSLQGSGWVNMRRELHLDLFANVGRKSLVGSTFKLLSNSRAATLLQIEVNGTTSDPIPQLRRPISLRNSMENSRSDTKVEP